MIRTTKIESPLGELVAGATDDGVCLLEYSEGNRASDECRDLVRLLNTSLGNGDNNHLQELRRQLEEYFSGNRKEFNIPLISPGTDFQQTVWKQLEENSWR